MRLSLSDAAAALDLDPERSPLDAYCAAITGKQRTPRYDVAAHRSTMLLAYQERAGEMLAIVSEPVAHRSIPWLIASPDAFRGDMRQPVAVVLCDAQRPGEHWHTAVPQRIAAIAQLAMSVTDTPIADIITIAPSLEIEIRRITRAPQVEAALLGALEAWWADTVEAKLPPPGRGSDAVAHAFATYPEPTEDRWALDDSVDTLELCRSLRATERALRIAQANHDLALGSLLMRVGDRPGLRTAECVVQWELNRKKQRKVSMRWYDLRPADPLPNNGRLTLLYVEREKILGELHALISAADKRAPGTSERIIREVIEPAVDQAHGDSMLTIPDGAFFALRDSILLALSAAGNRP